MIAPVSIQAAFSPWSTTQPSTRSVHSETLKKSGGQRFDSEQFLPSKGCAAMIAANASWSTATKAGLRRLAIWSTWRISVIQKSCRSAASVVRFYEDATIWMILSANELNLYGHEFQQFTTSPNMACTPRSPRSAVMPCVQTIVSKLPEHLKRPSGTGTSLYVSWAFLLAQVHHRMFRERSCWASRKPLR